MKRDQSIYSSFSKRKENVYHAPRRNETLNKEIDFPDIGFLSGPTNDTSNNILTYEHIQDLNENDYIMISDLDEIPNLRNLNSIVKSKFTAFQQTNYSFKFNLKNITFPIWYGTKLCKKNT